MWRLSFSQIDKFNGNQNESKYPKKARWLFKKKISSDAIKKENNICKYTVICLQLNIN